MTTGTTNKFFTSILILAMLMALVPAQFVSAATPTELFFSEYIEGSSNNKALEIYNGTGAAVDLTAGGYNIQMFFNGSASAGLTINLTGTVADGDVFVIAQSSANATILAQADQTQGSGWFNGDDAVVLRKGTTVIDVIGQIGFDPGSEWGTGLVSTADNTLRRKIAIEFGDPNGSDVFDPSVEWDGFATDTFNGLGCYSGVCPANLTINDVSVNEGDSGTTSFDFTISLSPPAGAGGVTFDVATTDNTATMVDGDYVSQTLTSQTIPEGSSSYTFGVLVNGDTTKESDETFFVNVTNVIGAILKDGQGQGTIVDDDTPVCEKSYTPIYSIQGSGLTSAITGTVSTQGVVVGDYEGPSPALRGFYLQDFTGDGDAATSDGIFVFNGNNDSVILGDVVRVTGTASDYQDQTQISSVTSIANCGTGSVAPVDVTMPFPSATYLEQFEGMLVRFPQALYVTEHYQLGRFGQVLLSSGGKLQQPTNIVAPGAPALALQAANDLNKIILDDDLNNQNPDPILFGRGGLPLSASNTLRGGDTATGIVGIMTYTWAGNSASGNAYRIRPINALGGGVPDFQPANPRPMSAPEVGGTLKVVGMNLLNFFNTFSGCTFGVGGAPTDCRGASSQAEFDRQWVKTVAAIIKMDADVIGFNEIENDGYGPDSSIAFLVDKLNEATAPGTYAFINADAGTGQTNALGTDAIRVGMIYKPANVTPVGQTAALNSDAFVNGGDSGARNRPSLLQAFEQNVNGQIFLVDVNHLKSKGSACDDVDALDGQGNCNIVRVNAVNELIAWFATDPTGTGDPDILMIGDYNSYAKEDPITTLENGGFTNLVESFVGLDAYSYVFNGQWGYLDQALGSASMTAQIKNVADYHIDSDEPSVLDYLEDFKSSSQLISLYAPDEFRISDHDPVMIGVCQPPTATANATPDVLWPANHKYVDVSTVVNASSDTTSISLVSVTSNEPDNGDDDGDTVNDIVILGDYNFQLRAERSGIGAGRIYTITYLVTNTCGATTTVSTTVTVPLSQGK